MTQDKVPMRPKGRYRLRAEEMDCLTWYMLKGCSKDEAYGLFVRKDLVFRKTTLKSEARQFFASAEAQAYMSAYDHTLSTMDVYEAPTTEQKRDGSPTNSEAIEQKKLTAIHSLIDWVTEQSININDLDLDTAALLLKMSDKVGLFDNLNQTDELPRRYLPVRCQSECQYRLFCETNTANGNIINECDYCRARAYAEQNGFHYDATKNLDIPKDVLVEKNLQSYTIIEDEEN